MQICQTKLRTQQQSHSENLEAPKPVKRSARPLDATEFSEADREKFWSRVKIGGLDECWEWMGARTDVQYGSVHVAHRKSRVGAHRIAYAISRNTSTEGLFTCHRCDNPPCCNPCHLFTGTHQQNMHDCIRKGRHKMTRYTVCGEKHCQSTIPDSVVREMKKLYADGMRCIDVCKKFGMIYSTAHQILSGRVRKTTI